MIVIDIEVFESNLHLFGDGSIRDDGWFLCVGLYDGSDYICAMPDDPRLPAWLSSDEDKCFHNGVYDLSWLICNRGFSVNGKIHDTMTRTALIDEYADLDLDSCCKRFGVQGKNAADTLEVWFEEHKKSWNLRGKVWDHADILWHDPEGRKQMIKYNKQDCIATYNLYVAQEAEIDAVREAYDLECALYPLVIEMKKNGIRLDLLELDRFTQQIHTELNDVLTQLNYNYNITQDIIASPKKMTIAMGQLGIQSNVLTATGAQSWSADALELIDHPVVPLLQAAKNYSGLLSKFLEGSIRESLIGDRVHCTFSPNKRDDGGTITGRFACKKPNLQQVPARDEKHGQKSYGQEMRMLFIPEEGCMLGACDFSQIEYLLLAHYAQGHQAEWFRAQANAGIDFHTVAQEMTGIKSRDVVKRMNYGFIYGMGLQKLITINRPLFKKAAAELSLDIQAYGAKVYQDYHNRLPVIRATMKYLQDSAKAVGYVASIGGRRHHKPRPYFTDGRWVDGIYKMTNYVIQGSAAEILKRSLLDCWDAGIFKVLKLHLTVHDENVVSIPYNKIGTEAAAEMKHLMDMAYHDRLLVPMKAVMEVGPNWGWWKSDIWEEMQQGNFSRSII